jgi:ribosomal protein L32E
VPPQQIRHIQREDRERYLRQNPHLHQKFEQRFRGGAGNNPESRAKQKERRQQPAQQHRLRPDGAARGRP